MRRKIPLPGGDLEHAVLLGLWELGEASALDIHRRVGAPSGPVHATTAKVLDRLHAEDLCPASARAGLSLQSVLPSTRRILTPDVASAMATLAEAVESIAPELLDELARQVESRRTSHRGS